MFIRGNTIYDYCYQHKKIVQFNIEDGCMICKYGFPSKEYKKVEFAGIKIIIKNPVCSKCGNTDICARKSDEIYRGVCFCSECGEIIT